MSLRHAQYCSDRQMLPGERKPFPVARLVGLVLKAIEPGRAVPAFESMSTRQAQEGNDERGERPVEFTS
jgi:hypothetical protein